MRAARVTIWLAGLTLGTTLLVGALRGHWLSPAQATFEYAGTLAAVTLGLAVWRRRRDSRTGPLLVALAIAAILPDLDTGVFRSALPVTVGLAATELLIPLYGHVVLSYPTGRLDRGIDR